MDYKHIDIEKKWQKHWDDNRTFRSQEIKDQKRKDIRSHWVIAKVMVSPGPNLEVIKQLL